MNCSKCDTLNKKGAKICSKCKEPLTASTKKEVVKESTEKKVVENKKTSVKDSCMGYLLIMVAVILKPFDAFKKELKKFDNIKDSAILAAIVAGIATIINLITSMINIVRVEEFDWFTGETSTTWVFENLKELNYFEVIGKNLLIYLGVIVGIACIYYIVSLVFKKQPNFSRLLGISTLSIIPFVVTSLILTPIFSMIMFELGVIVFIVGTMYTFVLLYEGINGELELVGNNKYYFNLICLSVILVILYFVGMEMLKSAVGDLTGSLGDLSDIFE